MFEKFINAYKMAYFKIFGDDFYGRFKRFENELTEPKFHASTELKDELRKRHHRYRRAVFKRQIDIFKRTFGSRNFAHRSDTRDRKAHAHQIRAKLRTKSRL